MTLDQLAAWLRSLFDDEVIFSGWIQEYDPNSTTTANGEIHFKALALAIAEKCPFEVRP